MKYRLKDAELQAKLDEISGGDFSHQLKLFANPDGDFHIAFGQENDEGLRRFCASFSPSDIEKTPEYTPNAWNELSDVRPPELGIYRVEVFENADDSEPEFKRAGYWDGRRFHIEKYGARVRFRPWEDEE